MPEQVDNSRMSVAMRQLKPDMSMETLYATACDLYRKDVLQVVEDNSGAMK